MPLLRKHTKIKITNLSARNQTHLEDRNPIAKFKTRLPILVCECVRAGKYEYLECARYELVVINMQLGK